VIAIRRTGDRSAAFDLNRRRPPAPAWRVIRADLDGGDSDGAPGAAASDSDGAPGAAARAPRRYHVERGRVSDLAPDGDLSDLEEWMDDVMGELRRGELPSLEGATPRVRITLLD